MTVKPFNLETGEYGDEFSCSPREAVIAAHAQEHDDFNTWEYEERYGQEAVEFTTVSGCLVVRCGNWTTGGYQNGR